jgi:hypothetical protein
LTHINILFLKWRWVCVLGRLDKKIYLFRQLWTRDFPHTKQNEAPKIIQL